MASVLGRMLREKPPDGDGRKRNEQIALWVIDQALTADNSKDRWEAINWIWEKVDGPAAAGSDGVARYRIDRFLAEIPHGVEGPSTNGYARGSIAELPPGTVDG